MPMLKVDRFGNYYEADPDSPDGSGCKGAPPMSFQMGDVYLDHSARRSEVVRNAKDALMRQGFGAIDQLEAWQAKRLSEVNRQKKILKQNLLFSQNTPAAKNAAIITGLNQAAQITANPFNNVNVLTGNGLSANGLNGRAGYDKHRIGAEIALGQDEAYPQEFDISQNEMSVFSAQPSGAVEPPDPIEMKQYLLQKRIDQQRTFNASNDALLNAEEAANDTGDMSYIDSEAKGIALLAPASAANPALAARVQNLVHPFYILFGFL